MVSGLVRDQVPKTKESYGEREGANRRKRLGGKGRGHLACGETPKEIRGRIKERAPLDFWLY